MGGCIYINPGPQVRQGDRTAWLKERPIAHRGLHSDDAEVPENSLKACQRALDKGYGIEIDVQMSSDGQAVVFHDHSLKRMTGLDRVIHDLPWEELKNLKLLGSEEKIPRLKDVLTLVQGQVPLLIEIKNEGVPVGRLEEALIKDLQDYTGDFAIQAFNPFVLKYIKEHAPDFVRGQLSASFRGESLAYYKKFLLKYLLMNHLSSPAFIAYETGALPKWFAQRLRQKGLYLLTWTVKDRKGYDEAMKVFDNVIFEGFSPE